MILECNIIQIRMKADSAQKRMNLNSVCLCFQAFVEESNGILRPVTAPVYSNPINNLSKLNRLV